MFFGGPEALFVYILLGRPSEDAYSEVPSQVTAHLRTGGPLLAGEIAGYEPRTVSLQSGVTTIEPPLLPEPPLLSEPPPLSEPPLLPYM